MRPPTTRRICALVLTILLAPSSPAQEADPIAGAWAWLATAPERAAPGPSSGSGPAQRAFDELVITADPRKPEGLVAHALAARLDAQLGSLTPDARGPLAGFLSEHPGLAAELAFVVGPEDDVAAAYGVLARLVEAHGERVADLAPLAAAMCVVHDTPAPRHVNENTVHLIEAAELFGYFAACERSMQFSLRDSPARLLALVADATGTTAELEWARGRYGRDRNIGNRYQEITYDTRALRQADVEKRVTASGTYTLQSIRKLGGVCADQAYFAATVGKACGVPTCSVVGRGGEISHAWIGYLERTGDRIARWNFSEGRYEDYEDVQGTLRDPQTGRSIPDAFLAIEARSVAIPRERRMLAAALTDAARRVPVVASAGAPGNATAVVSRQLELLEGALRLDPGRLEAWLLARDILASGRCTLAQKELWAEAINQIAGPGNPDFAFEILAPVLSAEEDPGTRIQLWEWAATRFAARPDLAARARLEQARVLLAQDRKADAGAAAWSVFEQYREAGPVAVEALAFASQILEDLGRPGETLGLYARAWRLLNQPSGISPAFLRQTSWYRVGIRYATLLERSGDARGAANIRRRLQAD